MDNGFGECAFIACAQVSLSDVRKRCHKKESVTLQVPNALGEPNRGYRTEWKVKGSGQINSVKQLIKL